MRDYRKNTWVHRADGSWRNGSSVSPVNPSSIHQVVPSGKIRLPGAGRADTSHFPDLQICLCSASQSTLPFGQVTSLLPGITSRKGLGAKIYSLTNNLHHGQRWRAVCEHRPTRIETRCPNSRVAHTQASPYPQSSKAEQCLDLV